MNSYFTDYSEYLQRFFPGLKVQKISVNTGNGCPNRDGTLGTGGCIYCRNDAFTPGYCLPSDSITTQVGAGKRFFSRKYADMRFLVYFQSYTGTYRLSVDRLREQYTQALRQPDIVGLIVGTRPDCMPEETVQMLAELNHIQPVFVELGIETVNDTTLRLINRGHTWAQARDTVILLAEAGLHTGVHLIAGLPGESPADVLDTIRTVCALPIESIKMHHLQVLRDTPLARMLADKKFEIHEFSVEEYLDLCVNIIDLVPKGIAIERFLASSPHDLVISPKWGLKNYEFTNLLLNKLKNR